MTDFLVFAFFMQNTFHLITFYNLLLIRKEQKDEVQLNSQILYFLQDSKLILQNCPCTH